ncbi:MAG: AAA family ATPase [Gammaproteobacteria bacterium]|nr:AAA family ATPase [Gammaproteobacteria bacterium]MCY4339329.1 AAA family ATPase [Gammaproteobacteria bacterium]
MYARKLNLQPFARHKSLFLLGPRQTGKSTLLQRDFPEACYIDLLDNEIFRRFAGAPERLRDAVGGHKQVIVDEIQKLPGLLDETQRLIDTRDVHFLLTGSSARKLRRGKANLLGGRALFFNLHPLCSAEIGYDRIPDLLQRGGLPGFVDSPIHWEELRAYTGAYLREEIQAEALTRSIENFSRFLDVAVHFNCEQLNYSKIGNDADIAPRTIKDYVKILEDTLVLHILPPFCQRNKRKLAATEKVYFFDIGVANALARRRELPAGSPEYGKALEQLVFLELHAAIEYQRLEVRLSYWRTRTQLEVDFLLDDRIAIEVKATKHVAPADLKSLRAIAEELNLEKRLLVCQEPYYRQTEDGIEIVPVAEFCKRLWEGEVILGHL